MAQYVVPGFVIVLCVFVPAFTHFKATAGKSDHMIPWFTIIPLALLMLLMYMLKPSALVLDGGSLTIMRLFKPVTIQLSDIAMARPLDASEVKGSLRTFGNGGLFGYFGKFYNSQFGHMTWYCTQRKNYVLLEKRDGKSIVLSPDDPTAFLRELKAQMPGERIKV